MMQLIEVARMLRLDAHVRQPLDRRGRCLGVERRQDEVPGHRCPEGDLCGLLVADLADEEDVGIGAKDRPQAVGEGEPGPRVHLDLIQPVGSVFDRVLDRRQLAIGRC